MTMIINSKHINSVKNLSQVEQPHNKLSIHKLSQQTPSMRQQYKRNSSQAGFTLIEIMVVMVILGVLAMIVVPNVVGQSDKARVQTTKTTLDQVANGLAGYRIDNGRYPTTAQGIDALLTPPADAKNYPEGGYLGGNSYPTDSWDNDLQYVYPGSENRAYDLFSMGADGKQGGEGLDADIYANPR